MAKGQQTNQKFVLEMEYLLYLPDGYDADTTRNWPLMLFLHGAGERGSNLEKIKVHGPPMLVEKGQKFPFIIVSPQAQRGWNEDMLYELLKNVISEKRVDTDRIYLTGLSMGGFGTWRLAIKHPEMFAAIVPVCGGGDPDEVWKLRHTPVWCFHGEDDKVVPLTKSKNMIDALKEFNPEVKFTVYPETGHDSWINAYNNPQLYEWLLQQKKFRFKEVDVSNDLLKNYEGEYLIDNDNIRASLLVKLEDGKLVGQINNNKYQLKPASETVFFIDENKLAEMHFIRNENGEVDRVELLSEDRTVAKKKM